MAISTAITASAVARVVGIQAEFQQNRPGRFTALPQRLAVFAQGATAATYTTTKRQYSSALTVGQNLGFGSPAHLIARQLFPDNGDGVGSIPVTFYPLEDDGSGVAATGSITPSGTNTENIEYVVIVGGVQSASFVIDTDDVVADMTAKITAAINSELNMPVIATDNGTDVGLAAKWAGASANTITTQVVGSATGVVAFAITQLTGGLVNPSIDDAIAQVGDVWETMIINAMEPGDSDALDALAAFGEGRWGATTRKPLVAFCATTEADVNTAITVPEGRKTDRVNVQLPAPGSIDAHFVVSARQVARIISRANDNPPYDYGSLPADGLTPGTDQEQWTYAQRDQAVKAGCSTIEVKDGVINVADVVTMYHPDGDTLPPYRHVVDIVKLQNIIFNIDLEFASAKWDGCPLIPDDQPTVNPDAKKPKTAVAAAAAIVDSLGLEAIISDPETSKAGIAAEIDASNPKRLNMAIPVTLSGNTNIISIDLLWGFYFGTPQVAA